ncbi:CRYPTIC PRECOCIOUS family protein [Capsicum annuum]|nr:CRYPTIC PRECOCIOUS family protein [Capsicum annuum]
MRTDISCIIIVYQDELGGLKVSQRMDSGWIFCHVKELVVNIGDTLQAWSNDKLRSSEHHVVLKKLMNYFSLVFFCYFKDEKVILAPDEVVGLGVLLSFSGNGLTEMVDSIVGSNLYVYSIFHKSFTEVNEKGTEAATATAVNKSMRMYTSRQEIQNSARRKKESYCYPYALQTEESLEFEKKFNGKTIHLSQKTSDMFYIITTDYSSAATVATDYLPVGIHVTLLKLISKDESFIVTGESYVTADDISVATDETSVGIDVTVLRHL